MQLLNSINRFDKVTRFRLFNGFLVSMSFPLIMPVVSILKGTLLSAFIITLFLVLENRSNLLVGWLTDKMGINKLYKMGVIYHILTLILTVTYFISPLFFVLSESTMVIIETLIFASYSIKLNNHLASKSVDTFNHFQIKRQTIYADGALIGLLTALLISYFLEDKYLVYAFLILFFFHNIYMVFNYQFFDKMDLDKWEYYYENRD